MLNLIKTFATPTECPLCYWARMSAFAVVAAIMPSWIVWPLVALTAFCVLGVWIMRVGEA